MSRYYYVTENEYRIFGESVFTAMGFSAKDSSIITAVLQDADLFGIESHGISRISKYYNLVKKNIVSPDAVPEITFETPLTAVYNAHSAMGQLAGSLAMQKAVERAKVNGIGISVVRNSNHYGIAGYYALLAANQGLIGVSMTNTQAIMVPTFSRNALLGSNPIAFAFPVGLHGKYPYPFLFDAATTVITRGKIELYRKQGKKLKSQWVVDEKGQEAEDPELILKNIQNKSGGGILPLGGSGERNAGYKGYGFSMICEILTSVLAGGIPAPYKKDRGDTSHFFMAADPAAFGSRREISDRMQKLIDIIHSAAPAEGYSHIYIAGEKEFIKRDQYRKKGIPLSEETVSELDIIADELGVERICRNDQAHSGQA
jgi:LDH2 family malate/lactate/ureidoglycolate dehydrogenase